MERLLADAEKLTGVKYDISNLGDVYEAIHVIQDDLGLTGVAAQEGAETFTGSLAAMKASAENLMANLALGEDIGPSLEALGKTVRAFLFNNLFPMLGNILKSAPDLISGLSDMIVQGLQEISSNSDSIVQTGIEIVSSLAIAIVQAVPYLIEAAWNLLVSFGEALINADWATIGTNFMNALKGSLGGAAGEIFSSDTSTIDAIMSGIMNGAANLMSSGAEILRNVYAGITANLPTILSSGVEILSGIINGILEGLPQLITLGAQMVTDFAGFILDNLPTILDAGIQLLLNLVDGIITNLPAIVEAAATAMVSFVAGIAEHLPELLQKGIELIAKLIAGIISAIPKLIAALPQIFSAITGAFAKYDWGKIGIDLLLGIKNGILSAISTVVDAAKQAASDIWEAVKGFFEIGSPSKLMYYAGEMVDLGLANGIKENQDVIDKAMTSLTPDATAVLQTSMTASVASSSSTLDGKIDNLVTLLNDYLPQIADGNVQITLDGDAGRLFRLMQRESIRNTQLVGANAVLSATT